MRYRVTATIKTTETVSVEWYDGPNLSVAVARMAEAATNYVESTIHPSVRPVTLDVYMEMIP